PGSTQLNTTPSMQYYTVDEQGDVELPILGRLHVEGLKRSEVAELVRERLQGQVINPTVNVMLLNPTVVVMGEVNHPGRHAMPNGRLTLLEALGEAGDLTIYGRRDNVLVTREVDGKLEFARINLTSEDLFTSPYYYLQQNDVIYVSPNKVRVINSTNVGLWLSMVSTVASAATVIVTVVNVAK
ncbi:MAG: polysaccharide biosynthesis/export family protein, partial [Paludibacteraceae bacterium]|nr:polysaccharide biosynthesis/export family protein [Paludibacteraceae bacterium]